MKFKVSVLLWLLVSALLQAGAQTNQGSQSSTVFQEDPATGAFKCNGATPFGVIAGYPDRAKLCFGFKRIQIGDAPIMNYQNLADIGLDVRKDVRIGGNVVIHGLIQNGGGPVYVDAHGKLTTQGQAGGAWNLAGNAPAPGSFLGTTDASDLLLKTHNQERLTVTSTGKFRFNTPNPGNGDASVTVSALAGQGDVATLRTFANYAADNHYNIQAVVDRDKTKALAVINSNLPSASNALGQDVFRVWGDGRMESKSLKVYQLGWADYVFEPGYDLAPVEELAAYIRTHGHLPGVPTAEEVARDGLDVGEIERILLEKVEELTLYMIDLQKENESMRQELEKLKLEINPGKE
ncbi:MAG: hypothetical protein H6581_24065 [Bacteroidia bacterium]|nr:hypothetical protein [Bacteroidia bacterium]